ncbi:MAG TPA: patatin-like phospholipase family protein [Candidatus Micrarchaeota archaeon]|nr:patatin-like phospholipase family protein [Candidatus Micrarchaeota archaeon]
MIFLYNLEEKTVPTRPIRILSIDGGGFRGVIPATIIKEFERIAGKPMKDMFDVFIGTSTGAILATSLVAPGAPGQQTNRFSLT